MTLRFRLLVSLCVVLTAHAFAQTEQETTPLPDPTLAVKTETKAPVNTVSLGRVAQATGITKVYSKPSTRARVYYSVHPKEYLVVKDYKKGSPWKLVLLQNMKYGYARGDSMSILAYEYKVPASSTTLVAMSPSPRATGLSSRSSDSLRAAVADYALNFKGKTSYVWGGTNLATGADCSGFVKELYGEIGFKLPRTAAQQVNVGAPVKRLEDLRKGDRLYFWDYNRNMVGHTGIYIGNGYFVHSSRTHRGVDTDYLGEAKWMRLLVAARR